VFWYDFVNLGFFFFGDLDPFVGIILVLGNYPVNCVFEDVAVASL
jgi:hypothetical protein